MQGLGVILLAFAGWLAYCSLHSFRPIKMMIAIVTNPKDAAKTLETAESHIASYETSDAESTGSIENASDISYTGSSLNVGPLTSSQQALASVFPAGNPSQTDVSAYQAYANQYGAALYGDEWSGSQMSALVQLWDRESGWRPNAVNTSSGANGIPQELGHAVPAGYSSNPEVQIQWGLQYIKDAYGTPEGAWQHEEEYGWY